MSTVNLLLLAITVGLSIVLVVKPKGEKQQQTPKKSSNKNKKKNKTKTTTAVATAKKEEVPVQQNGSANRAEEESAKAWTNHSLRNQHLALQAQLDDMRDDEVDPTPVYNHVARIPAPAPLGPRAVKLTQQDVEDGWESVGVSQRPRSSQNGSSSFASIASTNPFSALSSSKVKSLATSSSPWTVAGNSKPKAPVDEPSKKQRQNAAKTVAKKEARQAQERERLARLARHRGEQEGERARANIKAPAPYVVKKASPRAALNEKGALIWE